MSIFETSYNIHLTNSSSKDPKQLEEGLGDTGLRSKARIRETESCLVWTVCTPSGRGRVAAACGEMSTNGRLPAVFLAGSATSMKPTRPVAILPCFLH